MSRNKLIDYEAADNPLDSMEDSENFWPSFADIMMLIVMIFLMVMVVLMFRNWDLLTKLKESVLAEQKSMQVIEKQESENQNLAGQLENALSEIAMLRMQLLQMQDEQASISEQLETVEEEKKKTEIELGQIQLKLSNKEQEFNAVSQNLLILGQQLLESKSQVEALQQQQIVKDAEYTDLKRKYDKLIRPARTPKGKLVIEIVYTKVGDQVNIAIKTPDTPRKDVSRIELNQILGDLKQEHPDRLYLKIIFPKGELISHEEAWNFTSRLLQKYDYYYQK